MATMRWGMLKPARVASLGTRNESAVRNTPCRIAARKNATAPTPRMSANRRSDWPGRRDLTDIAPRISELGEAALRGPGGESAQRVPGERCVHESLGNPDRPVIENCPRLGRAVVEPLGPWRWRSGRAPT